MTSRIFRILFACPPSEVGHGRVVEVEDFGIAFAVGDPAVLEDAKPPLTADRMKYLPMMKDHVKAGCVLPSKH